YIDPIKPRGVTKSNTMTTANRLTTTTASAAQSEEEVPLAMTPRLNLPPLKKTTLLRLEMPQQNRLPKVRIF
ncbi:hypothetical protein U1Q18_049903, partial [Sarracenia purpurea var. burkii]